MGLAAVAAVLVLAMILAMRVLITVFALRSRRPHTARFRWFMWTRLGIALPVALAGLVLIADSASRAETTAGWVMVAAAGVATVVHIYLLLASRRNRSILGQTEPVVEEGTADS